MKRMLALMLVAAGVQAAELAVYVLGDAAVEPEVNCAARGQAARMLEDIGVRIRWGRRPDAIEVRLITGHVGNPGRVAFATPYASRPVVTVLYDRVIAMTYQRPDLHAPLLAHVLVHELAHVLMRTVDHADSGVMKAEWSLTDMLQMKSHPLRFVRADAEMIRRALPGD